MAESTDSIDDVTEPSITSNNDNQKIVDVKSSAKSISEGAHEEGETFSFDYVKQLRKQSANYRSKALELQQKAEEAERTANDVKSSLKTTQEESKRALDESRRLNSAFEQRVINAELKAAAIEAGLVDMDAFKMADTSIIKITEKGEVAGIQELISTLKKDKPYLFKDVNTSNKNSVAPPADTTTAEKPVYESPKDYKDAERKFLASLM